MTLGPMDFRGPIEMTLTNQFVEKRRRFFLDHIKIRRKLWHFLFPFWSTQNQRCLIFELTPGPRLALDAPGCPTLQKGVWILQPIRHSVLICKVLHTWHQCSGKVHH